MANKQKHKYSFGFNTWDEIKALAGSAKRRNTPIFDIEITFISGSFGRFYVNLKIIG